MSAPAPPVKRRPTSPQATLNRRKAVARARAIKAQTPRPRLTAKRERFVVAYTGEANGNGREAARIAGFANPSAAAPILVASENVALAVRQRTEALVMGSEECLARLAGQARVDMGHYAGLVGLQDSEAIKAELTRLQAEGKALHITQLTPTRYGLSVKLADSQAALSVIAKHLGLLRERIDLHVNPPAYDTGKIRSLLADPRGMELVCELDARLAALEGPSSPDGHESPQDAPQGPSPEGRSIHTTPPSAGPLEATVGPSAPTTHPTDSVGADSPVND